LETPKKIITHAHMAVTTTVQNTHIQPNAIQPENINQHQRKLQQIINQNKPKTIQSRITRIQQKLPSESLFKAKGKPPENHQISGQSRRKLLLGPSPEMTHGNTPLLTGKSPHHRAHRKLVLF
jgi:hypothetical protein